MVIAIIMLLAALLLPALKQAKMRAQKTVCINNLHQISVAMGAYMSDNNGWVPPYINTDCPATWDNTPWQAQMGRYMGKPATNQTSYMSSLVGISFLRCPAPVVYQGDWQVYGLNLGGPSGLAGVSNEGVSVPYGSHCTSCPSGCTPVYRSPRSELLPANTYVVGDAYGWLLSPAHWTLNADNDGDGVNDSCGAIFYNQADPRHEFGLNFSYIDGHVAWVPFPKFLTNQDGMWGP